MLRVVLDVQVCLQEVEFVCVDSQDVPLSLHARSCNFLWRREFKSEVQFEVVLEIELHLLGYSTLVIGEDPPINQQFDSLVVVDRASLGSIWLHTHGNRLSIVLCGNERCHRIERAGHGQGILLKDFPRDQFETVGISEEDRAESFEVWSPNGENLLALLAVLDLETGKIHLLAYLEVVFLNRE